MIAMTGSSDAPGDTTHGRRASPATSPDHLLVWLRGHIHTDDDRVIDDRRLGDGFSLSAWVREVRDVNLADERLSWLLAADGTWARIGGEGTVDAHRRFREMAIARSRPRDRDDDLL